MTMQLLEQYMLEADRAFAQEDYVKGKSLIEEALALEPDYGEAHNYLGWLYLYQLNNPDRTEEHLKLAIRYKPNCRGAYVHLSAMFTDQGRFEELQSLMPKALEVRGINRVSLLVDWGRMYELMGKYRQAVHTYKEAMKASLSNSEMDGLRDHIRRSRRKRWVRWI